MPLFNTFSLLGAFVLGLRHGLEPGRGKAVLMAYMAQNNSAWLHLFYFGGLVALSHTTLMLLILLSMLLFFPQLKTLSAQGLALFRVASAALVFVLGLSLLWRTLRKKTSTKQGCTSACTTPKLQAYKSPKDLFLLALMTGLQPCPITLSSLVLALSRGQWEAFVFVGVFSLGLATVLFSVGLFGKLVGQGLSKLHVQWLWWQRIQPAFPILSALFIVLFGLWVMVISLGELFRTV